MTENKTAKVLTVIPARGGSKGVPRKNIRDLGGRPLIHYVSKAAKASKLISELVLSTDDEAIAEIGRSLDIKTPFLRPESLSSDYILLAHVAKHALDFFRSQGVFFDAVMTLQPTCPFLTTASIDKAIRLWAETGCDSVTSIAEVTKGHPHILKTISEDGHIKNLFEIPKGTSTGPRQIRDKAFYLTGGFYLRDASMFDRHEVAGHFLGDDSRAVVVSEIESVDINTPLDFDFASFLLETGRIDG